MKILYIDAMKKYTLYHIKGIKWGMTTRLKRRLRDQGYTIEDCCEFEYYDDIDVGADREKELNLKFGYPWSDRNDFRITSKNGKIQGDKNAKNGHMADIRELVIYKEGHGREGGLVTGKVQGKKNVESGHWQSISKLGAIAGADGARKRMKNMATQRRECPHCKRKIGGVANYKRFHGDNCKDK